MQTFGAHQIGVQAGDLLLFSDFEDDGEMWKGEGPRMVRRAVSFDRDYLHPPVVTVSMAMIDMSNDAFIRADLQAEVVTRHGFEMVFRTWGDSRVARIRAAWQAIGSVPNEDHWQL